MVMESPSSLNNAVSFLILSRFGPLALFISASSSYYVLHYYIIYIYIYIYISAEAKIGFSIANDIKKKCYKRIL